MMLSSVALPVHAYSLPRADENIWASARPALRPVGISASERAPRIAVRPPLRGEVPVELAELADPVAPDASAAPAAIDIEEHDLAVAGAEEEQIASTPEKAKRSDPFERMLFAADEPFAVRANALDAVLVAEYEAKRLEEAGVVDYAALRGYVLPEELIWRAPETPSEQAAREMRLAIRERLASRYDLENGDSGDIERFYAIAEGQALKDWGAARPAIAEPTAMKVVEAKFEVPAPVSPPAAPSASDLRGFLNSPAGLAALSKMDAAQISALTAMLREMDGRSAPAEAPVTATAPAPSAKATTKGPGVPALSFRRTAETETPQEATVRTLGGTDNLLLRGWQVMAEGSDVSLYREDAPGSKIVVKEGMILGALGAVVEVEHSDERLRVRFESGDEILGAPS